MRVTRFAWIEQRYASERKQTRNASAASCKHSMDACCHRNSAPNGWRSSKICLTNRAKGAFRMRRWVVFWYCRISFSAKFPCLWRLGVDCFLGCERAPPAGGESSSSVGGAERGFGVLFSRALGPFRLECYNSIKSGSIYKAIDIKKLTCTVLGMMTDLISVTAVQPVSCCPDREY